MEQKQKSIKVSEKAYCEIKKRVKDNPLRYRSRGGVGVVDDLLFGDLQTDGRGARPKKSVDKK